MPHGNAPGPGHALVVLTPGFGPGPSYRGRLSGEGALACAWIALNPDTVRRMEAELTPDQLDTYVELPVRSLAVQLSAELAVLNHRDLTLFACPDCELLMGRMRQVPVDEHFTEWQCWDCGHVFGGFGDYGALDIGIVD